jgi:hypothetical protein
MNAEIIGALLSALAGIIALLSTRNWLKRSSSELVLQSGEVKVRFRSREAHDLEPKAIEQRLRALAEVAPDAAIVDAWRTLEAIANHEQVDHQKKRPLHGHRLKDVLFARGLIDAAEGEKLEALWRARNSALHVSEEGTPAMPLEEYLQIVLAAASRANQDGLPASR